MPIERDWRGKQDLSNTSSESPVQTGLSFIFTIPSPSGGAANIIVAVKAGERICGYFYRLSTWR